MKKLVLLITVLFALSGVAIGMQGDPDFTVVYKTDKGDVTFNHVGHSEKIPVCETCHSKFDVKTDKVDKKVAHTFCKSCHTESGTAAAPIRCTGCHIK